MGGHVQLPGDWDAQHLTDLLAGRYGVPRTLVLDGFADPTVDASGGAALLAPLGDRAVKIRAWADAERWIGAGRRGGRELPEERLNPGHPRPGTLCHFRSSTVP
ncbi:hypothetical protein ACWDFL_10015 [Streptomyces bungoensis]